MPLPVALADDGDRPSRYSKHAQRALESAEFAVFKHEAEAFILGAKDQIDAQTLADAARTSLDEELRLLDEGLARAGTSKAALELVARKVNILANINDRRISQRFGR